MLHAGGAGLRFLSGRPAGGPPSLRPTPQKAQAGAFAGLHKGNGLAAGQIVLRTISAVSARRARRGRAGLRPVASPLAGASGVTASKGG